MLTAVESTELSRDLTNMLARVRAGDRFVITESGQAVARLVPLNDGPMGADSAPGVDHAEVQRLIAELKAARDRRPPVPWQEIREWVNEGRR